MVISIYHTSIHPCFCTQLFVGFNLSIPVFSYLYVHIPFFVSLYPHTSFCISTSTYQPLCIYIHMQDFVSLHPHACFCISTSTYQPLYVYTHMSVFVSLHPHTSLCIYVYTYQTLYLYIHIPAFVSLYPHASLCISISTYQPLYLYICMPVFLSTSTYQSLYLHIHRVLKSDGLVVLLTSQELLPIIEDICPHRSAANQSSFESPTSLLPQTHPKRMATSQTDGHNSNGWPHPKLLATPVSYPVVPSHMEDSRASHIKPDSIQCGLNDSTANSLWRTPSRRWMFVCGKLTDTCPPPLLAGSSAMGDSRHFALVSKHYVKLGNTDAVIVKLQKSL